MTGALSSQGLGLPEREFVSLTEVTTFLLDGVARDDEEAARISGVAREEARREWGDRDGPRWLLEPLSWIRDDFPFLFDHPPASARRDRIKQLKKATKWLSRRGIAEVEAIKVVEAELARRRVLDLRRRKFVSLLFREAAGKSITIWARPQASEKDHPDVQLAKIPSEFFVESGNLSIHRALATNPSFRYPRDNAEGYSVIHLVNEAPGEEYVKPRLTYEDAIKLCEAFNGYSRVSWQNSSLPTHKWLCLAAALMWALTRDAALTERLQDDPQSGENILLRIDTLIAAEEVFHGFEPTRFFVSEQAAWSAVRAIIADEKIEAEALSLERRGIPGFVTTEFPTQRIPSGDARTFELFDGVPGVEPKTAMAVDRPYRFANGSPFGQGRYWFDVRLKADDVFREFSAETELNRQANVVEPPKPAAISTEKLTPSSKKIRAAIRAEEEATGKPFPDLRPVERDKRLADRMRMQGLKDSEIPKERTFRGYFNAGPGKPAKSG